VPLVAIFWALMFGTRADVGYSAETLVLIAVSAVRWRRHERGVDGAGSRRLSAPTRVSRHAQDPL
jgi:hypothetical protein